MTKQISPKHTQNTQKKSVPALPLDIEVIFPPRLEACNILVGTGREDFVASRIAHAVEDADANLINMNVTELADSNNSHIVALRVDHRDPERVARSLERYGYNIVELRAADGSHDPETQARIDELIHYLSI